MSKNNNNDSTTVDISKTNSEDWRFHAAYSDHALDGHVKKPHKDHNNDSSQGQLTWIKDRIVNFREEYGLVNLLMVFMPVAIILRLLDASATAQFLCAAFSIIPLAGLLGDATEALSDHLGPGTGGLLNATFGNAAELIIGLFSVFRGLDVLVKSSLVGSIISNLLLVLGCAILFGGIKFKTQKFSQNAANADSNMCVVAAIGFLVPSMYHHFNSEDNSSTGYNTEHKLSLGISIIFLTTYVFLLLFQLKTHADLFSGDEDESREKTPLLLSRSNSNRNRGSTSEFSERPIFPRAISHVSSKLVSNVKSLSRTASTKKIADKSDSSNNLNELNNNTDNSNSNNYQSTGNAEPIANKKGKNVSIDEPSNVSFDSSNLIDKKMNEQDEEDEPVWSMKKSMVILFITTMCVVAMSEILTGAVEEAGKKLGLNDLFMGVIVIAIVGNAAEHFSAVIAAMHNDMNIAIAISFGSALQIAMFVMPVVVIASYLRSSEFGSIDLTLTEFEVFSVTCATIISWMIVQDGGSNWLEGLMLLVIYAILALAFYFSHPQPIAAEHASYNPK